MDYKKTLSKLKPLIIIILLFSVVFFLRAEAYNISGVPDESQDFYKYDSGLPYFSEMDSYYNYRLTLNYIEKGMMGDTKINGTDWDSLSYSPPGRAVDYPPLIVYVTSFFYYLVNLFGKIPLTAVAFWTGAIIGSLCVIPAYLFVRRITNDYGGIAAGILVGTAPTYFAHTYAGFFDTDMFNILLPLLAIWFFVESIQAEDVRKSVIFATLSAISLIVFSLAWVGYIFYLSLLIVFVLAYIIIENLILKDKKPVKEYSNKLKWFLDQKELFSLIIVLVLGGLFVGIFNGFGSIVDSIYGLIGVNQIQALSHATSYPNVYISVSELQIPTLINTANGISGIFLPNQSSIIGGVGGLLVFLSGIMGIGVLIWKIKSLYQIKKYKAKSSKSIKKPSKSNRKGKYAGKSKNIKESSDKGIKLSKEELFVAKRQNLIYVVLFIVWILMTGYAVTKGFRFVSTFSLPISLCAGIFLGFVVEYIRENLKTNSTLALLAFIGGALTLYPFGFSIIITLLAGLVAALVVMVIKKPEIRAPIVMSLVVLAVIAPSVSAANIMSNSVVPGTDDGMWNSMQWIQNNTPNNTVVMSWWDFGHLFTAAADRPVTFDGGSQNTPRAYWIGKAMLTNNETLSLGIFRMLSSSGDQAYLTLDNYTNDSGKTSEILIGTLGLSKDNAQNVMVNNYKLTPDQAQKILNYTHPSNETPFVFVASSDMLGKAGWWSYFGNWDFQKQNASRASYFPSVGSSKPQVINNTTMVQTVNTQVGNQMIGVLVQEGINGTNQINASIIVGENTTFQSINPHKLIIIQGNRLAVNEIVEENSTLSLLVIGENGTYTTVIMDKALEDSMFTKLFLMGGFNQTSFKFIHQEPGVVLWTSTNSKINATT
jgi:dolichyl-diphosphooligosaccharide--protein glycosyltransferase